MEFLPHENKEISGHLYSHAWTQAHTLNSLCWKKRMNLLNALSQITGPIEPGEPLVCGAHGGSNKLNYYLHVRFGKDFPQANPQRNACPAFLTAVKTLQVKIQSLDRNIWCSPSSLVSSSSTLPAEFNRFSLSDLLTEIISPAVGWQQSWISWT